MGAIKAKVIAGGRIALPADVRKQLGISEGDTVYVSVEGDEMRIRSAKSTLRRVQEQLRPYRPEIGNLSDELIADRRAEAAGE